MKIIVERPFILDGEAVMVGSIQDVSIAFGREMIHARKARAVDEDALPIAPLGVDNASGLVAGQSKGDPKK